MKRVIFYLGLLLCSSCTGIENNDHKIDELNRRISALEQRIELLLNGGNTPVFGSGNQGGTNFNSRADPPITNRCQAITRKGTQCRRKATRNGYCWQHS